jgi:methylmalonyl-CoA mutase C-terminal domain/subunit
MAPQRILMSKIGLDGHDRGALVVVAALRDAGFEVIYTGLHNTPAQVAASAVAEDVSAIGVSILSGAHLTVVPALLEELAQRGASDIPVFVGGTIPATDVDKLTALGVAAVFGTGSSLTSLVEWVSHHSLN